MISLIRDSRVQNIESPLDSTRHARPREHIVDQDNRAYEQKHEYLEQRTAPYSGVSRVTYMHIGEVGRREGEGRMEQGDFEEKVADGSWYPHATRKLE